MAMIVGFAVAVVATPIAARVAARLGVVDRPGALKVHERPVPYLGGTAVAIGLVGPVAVARPSTLVPLLLALALGTADDAIGLSPRVRVAAELVIAATAAAVVPARGPLGAVLTAVAVLGLLNAVNLLDGLDGLAAGVAAVAALGPAIVLGGDSRTMALALAGALAGFLVWNRPPARIYLGDGGSYLVGTALAILVAGGFGPGEAVAASAASMLFVAVPVADTSVAIVRRRRAGRPLFQGDRGHVYDQLVDRGHPAARVTLLCVGAQAALVAVGVAAGQLPAAAAVAVVAATIAVIGAAMLVRFTIEPSLR